MQNRYRPPVEQFLAAIWELEEEAVEVICARLAEPVGHTAPSVSEMVRRLQYEGYLGSGGHVSRYARRSGTRRQRCAQERAGRAPSHRCHRRSVAPHPTRGLRWEHVISDEVEQHLVVLLKKNPPTPPARQRDPGLRRDSGPGDRIRLERVTEQLKG